jgi:hypothetical protein
MLLLLSTGWLKGGDSDRETCSCPLATFNADVTSHGFHQEFDSRETQANPLHVAPISVLQPNEPFENHLLLFRGNSAAVIFYGNDKIFISGHINADAFPSIFQTIADQIPQDLLKLPPIMAERRRAVFSPDLDRNPFGFEKRFNVFLIFKTEIFHDLRHHCFQSLQERFSQGVADRKQIASKQIFLGTIDLNHVLNEGLSFTGISENSVHDPALILSERAIAVGLVQQGACARGNDRQRSREIMNEQIDQIFS